MPFNDDELDSTEQDANDEDEIFSLDEDDEDGEIAVADNPFGFDIPNLDDTACSPADYLKTSETMNLLSRYLAAKGKAVKCRLKGNVDQAAGYEEEADECYEELPEWAKW